MHYGFCILGVIYELIFAILHVIQISYISLINSLQLRFNSEKPRKCPRKSLLVTRLLKQSTTNLACSAWCVCVCVTDPSPVLTIQTTSKQQK